MKVVIVGAGKLGYTIAELLSGEQMSVTVIDREEDRLTALKNNLDVLTIVANGASPITMDDPDVNGADVFIAVTAIDEVNMVACILAKKHGIKHTIARIRDMQFLSEAKDYLKKNFDIDLMLNPEMIAAHEIYRILMTPAALDVDEFAGGKVKLFEVKIRKDSQYVDIPFKKLRLPEGVLAGLIFRDREMIIPHGDDSLKVRDNAYFIGFPNEIEKFSKNFVQRDSRKLERVMIIGAGRISRTLAVMLINAGVNVKVIEKDRERCEDIAQLLSGDSIAIYGDGTNVDLLAQEGVASADVVVCLTEDDKLNLMIALLAKHLGAKKTVVRVYRTEYADLIEQVGIDVVISARLLSASEVLAFVRRGGVVSVSILEGARAEAVEVIVQKGARVAGKKLMDVKLPKSCLVCAYVRKNKAQIPNGHTILLPGDRTILFCLRGAAQEVMTWFN
ncbi:MAG: Trk system potassium transporter TrkA [Selenomonadaceae bacterium]|nr:Trk system potassium transporter TrkA [Selenomonadaceae bacterium]MBQ9496343.1 Trk system potassium transporter TrkA [Selenomonadaceae bacterium]